MQQERNAQPQNCYAQRGRAPNLTSAPRDAVTNVGCLLLCCPQLLLRDVTIDSITVSPLQRTFAPGVDYMTAYDDWLFVQVSHRVNIETMPPTMEGENEVLITSIHTAF